MDASFLTVQLVDYLSPIHGTRSCSDETLDGDWVDKGVIRCSRCYLLNAVKWKYLSPLYQVKIVIEEKIDVNNTKNRT